MPAPILILTRVAILDFAPKEFVFRDGQNLFHRIAEFVRRLLDLVRGGWHVSTNMLSYRFLSNRSASLRSPNPGSAKIKISTQFRTLNGLYISQNFQIPSVKMITTPLKTTIKP